MMKPTVESIMADPASVIRRGEDHAQVVHFAIRKEEGHPDWELIRTIGEANSFRPHISNSPSYVITKELQKARTKRARKDAAKVLEQPVAVDKR